MTRLLVNPCWDVYGEGDFFSSYATGRKKKYRLAGDISHGWMHCGYNIDPEFIIGYVGNSVAKKDHVHLVHREDQELALKNFGVASKAIGHPFIYLGNSDSKNNQKSLIMPSHEPQFGEANGDVDFIKTIFDLGFKPNSLIVILKECDYYDAEIKASYHSRGLDVQLGAKNFDYQTFYRLKNHFSNAPYIFTNTIGSHIPYANYFGAKTIICGAYFEYKYEKQVHLPFCQNIGEKRSRRAGQLMSQEYLRAKFPFLFNDIDKACNYKEWAAEQLGENQKKSKHELCEIFGWNRGNDFRYSLKRIRDRIAVAIPDPVRAGIKKVLGSK